MPAPKNVYPIIEVPKEGTKEYMVRVHHTGECEIRPWHWQGFINEDRDDLHSDDEFLAKLP